MFNWFKGKTPRSYDEFMAVNDFAKAVELARAEVNEQPRDLTLRLRLADALAAAGNKAEAIDIIEQLADVHATKGQMAKGIALLKKVQKLDPTRSNIDAKLACYASLSGSESLVERLRRLRQAEGVNMADAPTPIRRETPAEVEREEAAVANVSEADILGQLRDDDDEPAAAPVSGSAAAPAVPGAPGAVPAEPAPPAAVAPPAPAMEPIPDLDDLDLESIEEPGKITSPLFSSFSEQELLAVMKGLNLVAFDPGQIIMTEGEAGDSLFVVTDGMVRVHVRDAKGASREVRQMAEGAFFGEISILAGKPRTATITAGTRCELLELDRKTLDSICERQPRVRRVLQEFYEQRIASAEEKQIRGA